MSPAERIARIAQSAAAQAAVDQAPPLTREQLDVARAACASATARFHEREIIPVTIGAGCPCGCAGGQGCIRHRPVLAVADWPDYGKLGHLHAGQCGPQICERVA